jgi:hypothetical protein
MNNETIPAVPEITFEEARSKFRRQADMARAFNVTEHR